ncbi:hypothetical protein CMI47_07145 [Candidatus Pacearchaeota archaeon]|nr:hypothetical protein [Candidatus Pacearchaeota archaeon]|tara:strand:- start:691 stop:1317 length:627 start_codon:yes stop_codon:yes gene_type:complete
MISIEVKAKVQSRIPEIRECAIKGDFPGCLNQVIRELGLDMEPRMRLILVFLGECFIYSPECINDGMVVERAHAKTIDKFEIDGFTMELVKTMDDHGFAYMLLDILKERDVLNEFGRALHIDRELGLENAYVNNYLECVSNDFRMIGRLEVAFLKGDLPYFYRLLHYHIRGFWTLNLIAYEKEIDRRLNGLNNDFNCNEGASGGHSLS